MSVNQSRNEPPHHRRPGRSGNPNSPRNFSGGGGGRGGGGGGSATGAPSSGFYSGKSFKKVVSNAQGAQTRVTGVNPNANVGSGAPSNSSTGGRGPPNGGHAQPPVRGTPDASSIGATVKPADAPVQKNTPGLPKAPQSNAVPPSSGATGPSTPVKGPADASKGFPLQFGSISPGVMNGMQVPARTSSAPPNLDEQKRAQAHRDSLKAVSKQHLPRKDPGPVDQPGEAHHISKEKKDVLSTPPGPVAAHALKPSGPPMPSIPMQMPFHQPQIHLPFGSPNPPLQSQNISGNTMPLPMHLPVGNPPPQVPPQVFVSGIQHHQGMIHQNQGMTFSSPMGPQLGNMGGMGMGLGPQYQQQPVGNLNFGSAARRTVKITHPDTHEELRLDKRTDAYPNGGSSGQRSQPFPPAGHPMNYYPNSYNPNPLFPQPPGSSPLTGSQTTPGSQPPRFYHQASKQVTVKQPVFSSPAEKVADSKDKNQRASGEGQPRKDSETIAGSSLPQSENLTDTSASSAVEAEVPKKETVNKSVKEEQKIGEQSSFVSNDSKVQETSKLSTVSSEITKDVLETSNTVEEANRTEEEGEMKQSEEEREEKRVKARRRMLGNIRLIGELYKKRMLTERIMHECIKKLLGINQNQNPNLDEENIEALCKLMSTIGEMIDHSKAKEHMDYYFDLMLKLSNNMTLSSRVRFMLKDAIDLRKNKWQQRRKVEGPKKIEEVHRDAANELKAQASRLARGPNSNPSLRRGGQPMDFGSKGSAGVIPSNPQMSGGFRGLPQQQMRGFGNQDSRFDSYENKTLSVPLRPMGNDSITLGPQGDLARGMSARGHSSMQGIPGPNNGYGSSMMPDRGSYGPRDDLVPRHTPERFSPRPGYDPSNIQEHNNMNNVNRHGFDRVRPSTPPERARVPTPPQSGSSDKPVLSEDRLHDMSVEAIKEFYSARDEKEVALCIKDLNAPGFYPSMISIWVTDSFERKDMDRDSLAKLLVNLTKSQEGILTQDSLVRGFESVLSTLEDAVNDAPKAAEFLGRMFARMLIENVIPYKQVSRLIYEGGEEQGQLVETGLAAEVLGVILEIIKSEKGDPFLNDLCASSNIRLESFRSPSSKRTSRLDKFI
ncbi:putative MIF4G-like, type 3, initiation factor eIF-4 gamma, MA3, MIF4G-like domain superfamily [Helianthus annuus]|nr:putative MIF4G-like, type 3, initiation factor eIF-4 gamma, MA3, MIF4G-like domain superfamily [Helianthus annuus]KAJ0448681.1 putative MIF4G-like, type 3, initiation factor eIF-4 gamma, MA3, MIF4G-like domain superfamily [Helianthus annuus]